MVGFVAAMGAEVTGHSVASQVFSPGGIRRVHRRVHGRRACAPVALNKVTIDKCFPDENASYPDEQLPTIWTPIAEKLNGRVASGGVHRHAHPASRGVFLRGDRGTSLKHWIWSLILSPRGSSDGRGRRAGHFNIEIVH